VHNGFGLGEGGDLQHKTSSEAPKFKFTQNCPTKHCTATFAKPVLPAGVPVVCVGMCCGVFFTFRREGKIF